MSRCARSNSFCGSWSACYSFPQDTLKSPSATRQHFWWCPKPRGWGWWLCWACRECFPPVSASNICSPWLSCTFALLVLQSRLNGGVYSYTIYIASDHLFSELYRCMLLGHYIRGLEYRLELAQLLRMSSDVGSFTNGDDHVVWECHLHWHSPPPLERIAIPGWEMVELAITMRSLYGARPNTRNTTELYSSCCSSCKFRRQPLECKASVIYGRELLSFSFDVVPYKKEFGCSLLLILW